jgi:hypothetical protein
VHDLDAQEQQRAGHREPAADRVRLKRISLISISADGQERHARARLRYCPARPPPDLSRRILQM